MAVLTASLARATSQASSKPIFLTPPGWSGKNVLAELPVQHRRDQRDGVFEPREVGEGTGLGNDRIVAARPGALPAVDAAVFQDLRLCRAAPRIGLASGRPSGRPCADLHRIAGAERPWCSHATPHRRIQHSCSDLRSIRLEPNRYLQSRAFPHHRVNGKDIRILLDVGQAHSCPEAHLPNLVGGRGIPFLHG